MHNKADQPKFLICCSECKRVYIGDGSWIPMTLEYRLLSDQLTVSHRFCEDCVRKLYGYLDLSFPLDKPASKI